MEKASVFIWGRKRSEVGGGGERGGEGRLGRVEKEREKEG